MNEVCGNGHKTVQTAYVRILVRNERTHQKKQQFVPAGVICLSCEWVQWRDDGKNWDRIRVALQRPGRKDNW